MPELLAPAGSYQAVQAAVASGANAVYLGLSSFSARAYAQNFSLEELRNAVEFCHLRGVKIYVAMNTIIYEQELPQVYELINEIYLAGVDAVIVQDLALINYLKNFDMDIHGSTQMGVDDCEGALLLKKLGVKRVVLGREVKLEECLKIKKNADIEVETFIHGALCVSYSGNCLMSGLIGCRSGNRGRCVGCCRKQYRLHNLTSRTITNPSYLLSLKDLRTTENIDSLKEIDSLKIEGRMKEVNYVASVTSIYRNLLTPSDQPRMSENEIDVQLAKTFQRTFTKGYLFGEDQGAIANTEKPNNYGLLVGKVSRIKNGKVEISLTSPLRQYDQIRIVTKNEEINLPLTKLYNEKGLLINQANDLVYLEIKEKVSGGDLVYQTKDTQYLNMLERTWQSSNVAFPVDMTFRVSQKGIITLNLVYEDIIKTVVSDHIAEKGIKVITTESDIQRQLKKLSNESYYLRSCDVTIEGSFYIPLSTINELRRMGIDEINAERLVKRELPSIRRETRPTFAITTPTITVTVLNEKQYQAALDSGILPQNIYYKTIIPRNSANYQRSINTVVGGLGGLIAETHPITDYSLNVVNSEAVGLLHQLGARRVTLSHEINKEQINHLLEAYHQKNGGYPNLEMIVYGRQPMMVTKYCPLKQLKRCGECKKGYMAISDEHNELFPLHFSIRRQENNTDCQITIFNSKILNLIDELPNIQKINYFRLTFTFENPKEVKNTIELFKRQLQAMSNGTTLPKSFDPNQNTRGHYNKEIE